MAYKKIDLTHFFPTSCPSPTNINTNTNTLFLPFLSMSTLQNFLKILAPHQPNILNKQSALFIHQDTYFQQYIQQKN